MSEPCPMRDPLCSGERGGPAGRGRLTRRRLLQGALAGTLALPLLASRRSVAQGRAFPTRLVVFYTPNGTNPGRWFPTPGPTESAFSLTPQHAGLQPWKERLLYLGNVAMESLERGPGEPHQRGMGALLTGRHLQAGSFVGGDGSLAGWADGISVDQSAANRIGTGTRFKSLELGVRVHGSEVRHRLNYAGPAQPLPPLVSPRAAWEHLFGDFQQPSAEHQARTQRRRSVLDAATQQVRRLRERVSAEDRDKLDRHYTLLRELELRMGSPYLDSCALPMQPAAMEPEAEENMVAVATAQLDLAVAALACDVTRVVTLQMSSSANNIRFPHLESLADDHSLSHAGPEDTASQDEWSMRQRWYAERFADLLARLDAIPEGDGTLLDHAVVFWCSELAQGNTHSHANMPFLLAGRGGGRLRTGRFVQYGSPQRHNDLLVAILRALGVEADTFGDLDYCSGAPLAGVLA